MPCSFGVHALPLGRRHVEAEQDDRRPVDRHRCGDPIERNAFEQRLHVGQAGDGHPALPHFALGPRVVRVVAHQRREVERHREPGLTVGEQKLVALVRVACAAESGELAHRPEPAAIAVRVDAARIRKLTRHPQALRLTRLYVERGEQRRDLAGRVGEGDVASRRLLVPLAPRGHLGP